MLLFRAAACGLFLAPACAAAAGQPEAAGEHADAPDPEVAEIREAADLSQVRPAVPAGTPVYVVLEEDLSTATAELGQVFRVTVSQDVVVEGTLAIPSGVEGWGEVTFVSRRGGFGKPGILGIALREMTLDGETVALEGRYREEGRNNNTATALTFFAVGILSGVIKGEPGDIPKGRVLKARTGQDIEFVVGAAPPEAPGSRGPNEGTADPAPAEDGASLPDSGTSEPEATPTATES